MKDDIELMAKKVSETIKYMFAYFKHLTTLNSASILIIVALFERVFKEPKYVFLIVIAFICFMVSLVSSVTMMRLMYIMSGVTYEEEVDEKDGLTSKGRKILSMAKTSSIVANDGFLGGIFFVSLFAIFNFLDVGILLEGGSIMVNNSILSAWSIFVALVGISLNAIFIKPYPGTAILGNESKESLYRLREKIGLIASILIVIGTAGQFISLVIL